MKYFALSSNDGLLYCVGEHETWDLAESMAQRMGLNHIWLIDNREAKSWVDVLTDCEEVK